MGRIEDKSGTPVPTGVKYLVCTQFLIRFSLKGTQAVLVLFLYEHLQLSENLSTELVHVFQTILNLSPILGAVLSDGYLGKYRTLLSCLLVQLVGMVLGAAPSAEAEQGIVMASVSALGLFFIAVTVGAQKPCITAFGGDQVDVLVSQGADRDRLRALFFSLWYVSLNAGSFSATVAIPPLRIFGSYSLIFSVQTAILVVGVLMFWLGRRHYVPRSVTENVFVKVGPIVVDALRFHISKSARQIASGSSVSGERDHLLPDDEIGSDEQEVSTGDAKSHWLDGAKLKHDFNAVEDVKRLFRVLVLFTAMPAFWALFEQQFYQVGIPSPLNESRSALAWRFGLATGNNTGSAYHLIIVLFLSRILSSGSALIFSALSPAFVLILVPLVDHAIYPFLAKLSIPLPPLRKMVIGMACAVVAFLASGALQLAMDSSAMESNSTVKMSSASDTTVGLLSVAWQVPQYVFITLAEVLINITGLEFAYSQAPPSMKSLLQGSFNSTQALGNFMVVVIVAVVGERLSKANEFFLFAGGCAAAMVLMVWITHGYDDCQQTLPAHIDPMLVETMVE